MKSRDLSTQPLSRRLRNTSRVPRGVNPGEDPRPQAPENLKRLPARRSAPARRSLAWDVGSPTSRPSSPPWAMDAEPRSSTDPTRRASLRGGGSGRRPEAPPSGRLRAPRRAARRVRSAPRPRAPPRRRGTARRSRAQRARASTVGSARASAGPDGAATTAATRCRESTSPSRTGPPENRRSRCSCRPTWPSCRRRRCRRGAVGDDRLRLEPAASITSRPMRL